MWYVRQRLCTHYTYSINKGTRQKSFMQGHWKIFIFFKQKEGIYLYKWRTDKIFSLVWQNCI
jgi:hypothetical protein